jgi:hypothetical protein
MNIQSRNIRMGQGKQQKTNSNRDEIFNYIRRNQRRKRSEKKKER